MFSISVFLGAAVSLVGAGGLPITTVLPWIGFGSAYLGTGVLLGIPLILYRPVKSVIQECW
jgi:hypothetical protein